MRALVVTPNQERGLRRNGVEMVASGDRVSEDKEENQTKPKDKREQHGNAGKEKAGEEELMATSPMERISHKIMKDGMGRLKSNRKRHKGPNGDNMEESLVRSVKRKLSENVSPFKAVAGAQPRHEP
ncbi:hypothetical protein PVK06_028368 [Gossypium arboreum]|uniref:Uncharacterized protein n=1 Tax=Gossypium arboreum TaxID=29729 RepID=A0ABR0P3W9_GOSAR|nr:hypothetical protein PVK06_028368 [Gossypium arboreum]